MVALNSSSSEISVESHRSAIHPRSLTYVARRDGVMVAIANPHGLGVYTVARCVSGEPCEMVKNPRPVSSFSVLYFTKAQAKAYLAKL